jgi:ABC-type transporter Mla subunit MlaD
LRKTEVERAQTFLSAFQSADLTQQLAAMSANLRAAAESLAAFKSDAHEVNQTWTNVLAGLNGLNAALSQFKELADGLNTSWADLGEGIKQAPELGRAAQTATAALNQLGSTVGQLQQTTAAVNAALAPVQSGLVNAVQMLQDRLEKLPPLADAVARFVELANRVAPTMEVLITTFQDIRSINENLRLAVGSLQNFNEQLNNANKATGDVATNADKLIKSTDNLVAEVANQLHKLKSLTEDWGKLGETVKELAPAMKDLKQQLGTVQEFSARVAELTQALARAEGILTSTTTKLDEVPAVVKDFIDTTRKLLTEGQPALPSDDEK